jgi:hypothetical protein
MMRAGKDYLTKGVAAHGKPRGRLVKRSSANRPTGSKDDPAKRQTMRKPTR